MPITIQTAGFLKEQIPDDLSVDANTVGEAVTQLDLGETGELILLVNGRMAHWQTSLNDGDVLKLVPAIGGGAFALRHYHDNRIGHSEQRRRILCSNRRSLRCIAPFGRTE